jgi:HEAT repeat protein
MNEPSPRPSASSEPEDDREGPLRTFVGLFLVPLLVVLLCVGVFIGFGWIAYEQRSAQDYLSDLRSGWRPRRAQAAYELSKILVADPVALDETPGAAADLRNLFAEAEDPEMRRYLALVLGHTHDPEAVPLLIGALEESDSQTRIYALWALGTLGDPRALQPLTGAAGEDDPGIRKTAAFALGELGRAEAVPALTPLLQDPIADVRWNAALALSRLGSDAGVPVLHQMLDRQLTAQVPGITPSQAEEAMVEAVRALGATGGDAAAGILRELAENDPSLKVRRAALEALEAGVE